MINTATQDAYLDGLDICAALALTVQSQGQPRAMLVLENRLWRGTFTEDRLDAVRIIAGQLVVSMENAALYASLEQKVTERTEQLRLANAQLEILSGTDPLTGTSPTGAASTSSWRWRGRPRSAAGRRSRWR